MIEIALKNIKKYYGGNEILRDVTFEVKTGEKVGIVGPNGAGKTSIFKIITGIENFEVGDLSISKGATIGHLNQVPEYPPMYKVKDILNLAFEEEFKILEEMTKLESQMTKFEGQDLEKIIKAYGGLQDKFSHLGGYDVEERMSKVCTGLKITEEMQLKDFNSLSGGEKTTVMLGKILLQRTNILLLDEPSNHLDMDSLEWLEEYIREYNGTVMIISHDRYFLDLVVEKILEIEDGEIHVYHGNYTKYVEEKNRRILEAMEAYKNQQKQIKSMEDSIKRFRQWGIQGDNEKFFKKAASIQKRLDKIDKLRRPIMERKKAQIEFESSGRAGKDVIVLKNVRKTFDDKVVLESLNMYVSVKDKVAIIGKNGGGKSTLIKIITGEHIPDCGDVKIGSNVKLGYLEQEIIFNNPDSTVLEFFRNSYPCGEGEARNILSRYLFYGNDVFTKVKSLSGGEKSRLRLCQLIHQEVNTLILDEPTNHLDIESREMLEEALENFNGTVIFISHDRYFVNNIAHKIFELKDGRINEFVGNFDYYKEKVKERENFSLQTTNNKGFECVKKGKGKDTHHSTFGVAKKLVLELEKKIKVLEEEISVIDVKMIGNLDYNQLANLYEEKQQLRKQLDEVLEKWYQLN